MFWRKTIWWLLALFALSAVIRIPNLNRPLSKHHEFCTALTLIIVQSWTDEGIRARDFNPSTTFSLSADKFINNCSMDTMQRDGNFYYLSHPPLAYYVPYTLFRILNINPGALELELINLLFEFITIVFIYLITALLSNVEARKQMCGIALFASGIYLFLPVTLWFQSNVYMADMFVQNLWAPTLYIALKIFLHRKERSIVWLSAFVVSLFLMIYTDWIGVFFAASIVIASLVYWWKQKQKRFLPLAAISIVISVATVSLVLFQYSSIAGWNILMYCYGYRYSERGSLHWGSFDNLISVIQTVGFNYVVNYLPVIIVVVVFLFKRKLVLQRFENLSLFACLTLLPVILDHIIFLRYAVQDFAVLKASFFLSILSAITVSSVTERSTLFFRRSIPILICIAGVALYYIVNLPGKYSIKGDRYAVEKEIGEFINRNANNNEIVFLKDIEISPQIVFYAHRNIKKINSEEQAQQYLKIRSISGGAVFELTNGNLSVEKIEIDSQSH